MTQTATHVLEFAATTLAAIPLAFLIVKLFRWLSHESAIEEVKKKAYDEGYKTGWEDGRRAVAIERAAMMDRAEEPLNIYPLAAAVSRQPATASRR